MAWRIHTGARPEGQGRNLDRIPALDGLRGVAVLWVVLLHSWGNLTPQTDLERFLHGIISAGWLGVDLFFALSGFLITRILLSTRDRADYLVTFYRRRFLRIFPLYFAVLWLAFAFSPLQWSWFPWFAAYGQNFYLGEQPDLVGGLTLSHFWSLCVEEHFYLLWPMVVKLVPRQHLLKAVIGVAGISLVTRLLMVEMFFLPAEFICRNSFCRFDSIALGAAVAMLPWSGSQYRKIFCVATIIVVPILVISDPTGRSMLIWGKSLIAIWAASAIGWVALSECRWLQANWLSEIGAVSYGVYVWHFLLMGSLQHAMGPLQRDLGYIRGGGLAYALLLGFGLLLARISWRLIEKPCLALR